MAEANKYSDLKQADFGKDAPILEEEGQILQAINDMYSEAKRARQVQTKIMEDSYLQFRSIMSEGTITKRDVERWGMAIFVPITFQVVASIQAQLNGRPPQYRVAPLVTPKSSDVADAVGKLSLAEFRRAKALREFVTGTQLSLVFGTAFLRSIYEDDTRDLEFVDKMTEDGDGKKKLSYSKKKHTFYKGWKVVVDHPLRVYIPRTREKDPQKWPFYIVRDLVDVRNLKDYYENHQSITYKDNWKYIKAGGDLRDDLKVYDTVDPMYSTTDPRYPGSQRDLTRQQFHFQEDRQSIDPEHYAERLRVYDMVRDRWSVVIAGRLIEHYPNPLTKKFLPVVAMRDYIIEGCPWGVGEPQLIRYLQSEQNALHTFALDGSKYATNGVFGVNSSMLKNPNDMSVYPGKIFDMKNMPGVKIDDVIQSFNMPDVKGSVFRLLSMNDNLVARTTGAGSAIIGGDPINAGGSATESNNLKAAATTRVYERARAIEQENLVDLIGHQIMFMADFYTESLIAKVSDEEFIKFVPGEESEYPAEKKAMDIVDGMKIIVYTSDLEKGYEVLAEGESTLPISRQERRIEGMQLLKLATDTRRPPTAEELAADPQIMQKYPQGIPVLDAQEVAEKLVLPNFTIIQNVDEFIWKGEVTQDKKRGVGRPANALSTSELEQTGNEANAAAQLAAPQPMNQGINQMERINQGPQLQ